MSRYIYALTESDGQFVAASPRMKDLLQLMGDTGTNQRILLRCDIIPLGYYKDARKWMVVNTPIEGERWLPMHGEQV